MKFLFYMCFGKFFKHPYVFPWVHNMNFFQIVFIAMLDTVLSTYIIGIIVFFHHIYISK